MSGKKHLALSELAANGLHSRHVAVLHGIERRKTGRQRPLR